MKTEIKRRNRNDTILNLADLVSLSPAKNSLQTPSFTFSASLKERIYWYTAREKNHIIIIANIMEMYNDIKDGVDDISPCFISDITERFKNVNV